MKIEEIDEFKDWFVSNPSPLAPAKIVTVGILRTTTDYAAFRTEADKTINSITTQTSVDNDYLIEKVVMLASKQKAAERRKAEQFIREVKKEYTCYVKDELCLRCPVCILNGGIGTIEKTKGEDISIRSRILYQSAYSIENLEEAIETLTFNAVDEKTVSTGQALNERELIKPGTHFISIVTLVAPTINELKFALKYILACDRYGAETRGFGTMTNHLFGMAFGESEAAAALEVLLVSKLSEKKSEELKEEAITMILHKVFNNLATRTKTDRILDLETLRNLEEKIRKGQMTEEFVNILFSEAEKLVQLVKQADRK